MADFTEKSLQLLLDTARKAEDASVLAIPGDKRQVRLCKGETMEAVDIPPPLREHYVSRLSDLIEMANVASINARGTRGQPVVWHDEDKVVLILDDEDRRDRATMDLTQTEQFKILCRLADNRPAMQQKEFIRMLRLDLGLDAAVVNAFRRIDWTITNTGSAQAERGKESLGKQIESHVRNAQDIPELLTVPVSIYNEMGEQEVYSIRCLIDFDCDQARMQMVPAAGELEHALQIHQMSIRTRLEEGLEDKNAAIYYGTP